MEDRELIRKYVLENDFKAFETLYNQNVKRVYAYVFRYIGNKHDTEDIVSQTFETLLEALKKFDGKSKFSTFLIGIAKNKIMQHIQRKYRKPADHIEYWDEVRKQESEEDESEELDKFDETEILLMKVKTKLSELDEKYRKVIELRYFEKLDTNETAEELGITSGNVRVIQNRAVKKLKKLLLN